MKKLLILLICAFPCFGAANMVATYTINTAGQYVVTFSPCSAPLTPSSAVSGISLANFSNGNAQTVVSATTNACILTVTTQQNASGNWQVLADDTISNIFFTITSGSNLTDNAGNTVSATGNTNIHPSANNSTMQSARGSLLLGNCRTDGSPKTFTQASVLTAQWMSGGGGIRCLTNNITGFNILVFNFSTQLRVMVDGAQVGSNIATTSGADWSTYSATGLSAGTHLLEIDEVSISSTAFIDIAALQIVGGTFAAKPAIRGTIIFNGASEAACFGLGVAPWASVDETGCVWWQIARVAGYVSQHFGVAGWPVTSNTACVGVGCTIHDYSATNLKDCAAGTLGLCVSANFFLGPDGADYIWAVPGGNDAMVSTFIGIGYVTPGTFGGDAVTMFGNLVTRFSPVKGIIVSDEYYVPGLGTPCPSGATQLPYETAWAGAAAAYGTANPSVPVKFASTFSQTCPFGIGLFQADGAHLNPTGQTAWANIMSPFLIPLTSGSVLAPFAY